MKNLTVIIADDEAPARDELKHILSKIKSVTLIGEARNGPETIRLVEEKRPDLLFLDIEMPGTSGIEVAKKLVSKGITTRIIFATAYDEYAVRAFEVNAIDYILKPFEEKRIEQGIIRAETLTEPRKSDLARLEKLIAEIEKKSDAKVAKIPIKQKGKIALIDVKNIVYARAEGGLIFISESGKEFLCDYTSLDSLESELDAKVFYRSSRSHIVNLDRMKEIVPLGNGHYIIRCSVDGSGIAEVPLSRRQAKKLKERYKF